MTTFGDQVRQYGGAPVGVGLFAAQKVFCNTAGRQNKGRAWFVDTSYGGNGNGTSPEGAFSTMARAFASIASGDVIYVQGRIGEQLVTPVNIFDVTVVGCGNNPRNADAVPVGGNWAAAQWGAPTTGAVAGQATVRVLQQGWRFMNLLFTTQGATAAGIEVVRNAALADLERDASHMSVIGCRFAGAGIGIRGGVAGVFTEIPFNVEVGWSQFDGMTTAMSAAIECNQWYIHDSVFQGNTSHIIMAARNFIITRNVIGAFTAAANSGGIDLRGGTGLNQVTWNSLSGTYSAAGGYQEANANDTWNGNAASTGFTAVVP